MTRITKPHYIHLAAIGAPAVKVNIDFADQASKAFCAYRDKYGFGASAMLGGCGNIYNSDGVLVGRISYNGRIWDATGNVVE
ncbi:MAG TPA: hypothetical protein VG844_10800 [Terracidiphilus sp.]|nr:hypothetical protein [Terracidiphilus sp.]